MDELSDNFLKFCSRIHGVNGDFDETNSVEKRTEIRRMYAREKPPLVYIDSSAKVTIKAKKTKASKEKKKSKKGKQNTKKGAKKIQNVNSPSNEDEQLQKNPQSDEVEEEISVEQTESEYDFMHNSNIMQNYDDVDYSQVESFKDNIKFMESNVQNSHVESAGTFSDLKRQIFKFMEADVEDEKAENFDVFSECGEQVRSYASVLKSNFNKEKSKSTDTLLKPTLNKKIGKWKKENIVHKFTISHL